jgi:hypothetical protein
MNLRCCSASGGGREERRWLTLEIAAAAKQDLSELRLETVAGAGFGGGGHFCPLEHSARASGAAGTAIGLLGTGAAAKLLVAHAHKYRLLLADRWDQPSVLLPINHRLFC